MGLTIRTRDDGTVEVEGGTYIKWTFRHFPERERTVVLIFRPDRGAIKRIRFPGLVLAVPYDDALRPRALYAYRRAAPLTGSLTDVLEAPTNVCGSYSHGRVCMGVATPAVLSGATTAEDAFWNTGFPIDNKQMWWMPVTGPSIPRSLEEASNVFVEPDLHWGFR